jgi:hypothetical protein
MLGEYPKVNGGFMQFLVFLWLFGYLNEKKPYTAKEEQFMAWFGPLYKRFLINSAIGIGLFVLALIIINLAHGEWWWFFGAITPFTVLGTIVMTCMGKLDDYIVRKLDASKNLH